MRSNSADHPTISVSRPTERTGEGGPALRSTSPTRFPILQSVVVCRATRTSPPSADQWFLCLAGELLCTPVSSVLETLVCEPALIAPKDLRGPWAFAVAIGWWRQIP